MLTRLIALMIIAAGCSTAGTPATVPASIPESTTVTTTVPSTTSSSTTTTTAATTTTLDRRSEIEAIFQDLEERRLQALYEGDREAFKALFANEEYMRRSMGIFDIVEFINAPTAPVVQLVAVLTDEPGCIAARVLTDATDSLGADAFSERPIVLEQTRSGWGFSYIGEGWECDGPHPFSS